MNVTVERFYFTAVLGLFILLMNSCSNTEERFLTKASLVTDMDGNVYSTVIIGTQEWMVENLKTTKYNDGTSIPHIIDSVAWSTLTTPGYCFYNKDTSCQTKYGALYNWYAVNTGKLAPLGWHIATDAEWTTLTTYLANNGFGYGGSGSDVAKALAANTDWASYSTDGAIGYDPTCNNSSGFAGYPGGCRNEKGSFFYIGNYGFWWSSSEDVNHQVWSRFLVYISGCVNRGNCNKQYGFSVRCLRDN